MSGSATGVQGLDAKHAWADIGGSVRVTLNDFGSWPIFKLMTLPGFFDGPDADDNRNQNTGAYGETVLASYARGKTVGYQGLILGRTRDECLIGKTTLARGFGPNLPTDTDPGLNPERRMVITPDSSLIDPLYTAASGVTHTFTGTVLPGNPKVDDQPPRAHQERGEPTVRFALPFGLQIRLSDGLFWEWDGSTQTNPKWA